MRGSPILLLLAVAALAGCGADTEELSSDRTTPLVGGLGPAEAPGGKAPPRGRVEEEAPPASDRRTQVATYRLGVQRAIEAYGTAQEEAFSLLGNAEDAAAYLAALEALQRSTGDVAKRLDAGPVPRVAVAPHRRFVAQFRDLEDSLGDALAARADDDPGKLDTLGRRLAKGKFSRGIDRAARQIDRALGAA